MKPYRLEFFMMDKGQGGELGWDRRIFQALRLSQYCQECPFC